MRFGLQDGRLNTSQLNFCKEMWWLSSRVRPSVIVKQNNTGTEYPALFVLNGPSQCFAVTLSIHRLISGQEVDEENALSVPEHRAHNFPRRLSLLEFHLAGRSTVTPIQDCCLVSWVMYATYVSSPMMIRSRNLSPSSWYLYRNISADFMRFALCSGASCFGNHLALNFLNYRYSVTIFCNKKRKICGKWLLSSLIEGFISKVTFLHEIKFFTKRKF